MSGVDHSAATTPKRIKKVSPGELMIVWADGRETHYLAPVLRGMCPCASCKDEITGMRIILPIHIPDDLEFRKIDLVGQYALQFEWSDGHRTGIFSFEYLRELAKDQPAAGSTTAAIDPNERGNRQSGP